LIEFVNNIIKKIDVEVEILKKLRMIAYMVLIIVIAILSFTIYVNASKDNSTTQKDKTFSEIQYMEAKLVDLFNCIYNIQAENYKIEVSELTEKEKSSSSESSSSGEQGGEGQKSGQSGGENGQSSQGGGQESSSNGGSGTSNSQSDYKKFDLKSNGVLTGDQNINWDYIKNQVEVMYESIPTFTIDLYQYNINKDDILSFNSEYDKLIIAAKGENKQDMLNQLSKLYEYISGFAQNVTDNTIEKNKIQTKSNVLRAYSKLDTNDWNSMSNDIKNAVSIYSSLLTDTSVDSSKQYNVNKIYISLNELNNAVTTKDASIFLIKYKNLLEEINNI